MKRCVPGFIPGNVPRSQKEINMSQPVCALCGKALKKPYWVNFDNQKAQPLPPDAQPAHGEFGVLTFGRECLKKFKIPRHWILSE